MYIHANRAYTGVGGDIPRIPRKQLKIKHLQRDTLFGRGRDS